MPTAAHVEGKIRRLEGFEVRIRYAGPSRVKGRDVRGDRADLPTYDYRRAARTTLTVAAWVKTRFEPTFPGYSVDVLYGDGSRAAGQTLLETVRGSYD